MRTQAETNKAQAGDPLPVDVGKVAAFVRVDGQQADGKRDRRHFLNADGRAGDRRADEYDRRCRFAHQIPH